MVPKNRMVRIGLDVALWGSALVVPRDVRTDEIDYSLVAGLDVLLFVEPEETAYGRLVDCCEGLLSAAVESLMVIGTGHFVARLRIGHEDMRGGYLRDCA